MQLTRTSPRTGGRWRSLAAAAGLGLVTSLVTTPVVADGVPPGLTACDSPVGSNPGYAVVAPGAREQSWAPLTPSKWAFEGDEVIMTQRGTAPPGPRRP